MVTRLRIMLGRLLLVIVITAITAISATASMAPKASCADEHGWATYVDPRFDFSVEYPANWHVTPRLDLPDSLGGSVIFEDRDNTIANLGGQEYPRIEIGLYLVERDASAPLAKWSEEYDAKFNFDSQVINTGKIKLGGHDAFHKQGVSLLTKYTRVNLAQGKTVWFVWTNSHDEEQLAIHDHIVRSLKFGDKTPSTLQEAYGRDLRSLSQLNAKPLGSQDVSTLALSGYRAPVSISAPILCGDTNAPVCSGTHSGKSRYAIDISVLVGTSVKNSATSYVSWTGWTDGMGWQARMYDAYNGYIAYYGHLSSITDLSRYKQQGWIVGQNFELGLSGNSGAITTGPHLHFHIETLQGAAVSLGGMANLALYNSYPNCGNTTCPGEFECTCGKVN